MCSKSVLSWQHTGLWIDLMAIFDFDKSFLTNVFSILQHLNQHQKKIFVVTLYSISKYRNNEILNNIIESINLFVNR